MLQAPFQKEVIKHPVEYSGAIQRMLYERYGDPRIKGWGNKWLALWKVKRAFGWFPEKILHVHRDFQPRLYTAFTELEYMGLHEEIITCEEDFNIRYINGSDSVLSVHSWGVALDMNVAQNPLGSDGTWSKAFINVMAQNNICCGQDWTGRKDPMHFSMVNA